MIDLGIRIFNTVSTKASETVGKHAPSILYFIKNHIQDEIEIFPAILICNSIILACKLPFAVITSGGHRVLIPMRRNNNVS